MVLGSMSMAKANVLPLTAAITAGDSPVGYEVVLSAQRFPFLLDHKVRNSVVVPGTAFMEMAMAVGQELLRPTVLVLEDIVFHQALFLSEKGERLLRCMVTPGESGKRGFLIESRITDNGARQAPWTSHVTGRFAVTAPTAAKTVEPLPQVRARCPGFVSRAEHYTSFERRGFEFGAAFQGLVEAWRGDGEAVGKILAPEILMGERPDYYFHPAMLDACLQVFAVALPPELARVDDAFLPIAIDRFCIHRLPGEQVWSHVRLSRTNGHELLTADVNIYSETGDLIVEVQGLSAKRLTRIAPCAIRERMRDSLYEMVWENYTPPAMGGLANTTPIAPNRWLLLADKGGVAQALAARLAEQGQECHLLYALEPGAGDKSREQISDALTHYGENAGLRGVVHLWSLDVELDQTSADIDFEVRMQSSCGTALRAIQAVAQTAHGRLWLVTRTAQACCNTDDVAPMAGALWGLGRVIAQEQPAHWGGLVDLDAMAAPIAITALANVLLSDTPRMGVAIRDARLYVPRLQPLIMTNADNERMVIHADRSYLITGGLGGVGRQLALWLAKQGAHHLTLLVRTPVAIATDPHHSATDARSRCLHELQALGVKVHIEVGDVSDAETVRALINLFGETLPPLAGVIHAAGIIDDSVLTNQNAARLARVFAPKARGAWNLHRSTTDIPLDFFVLCSSLAAVLGSPGQANYAAANAWVDALAQHRRAHGMPACAINWGPWEGTGMMQGSGGQRMASIGVRALPPEDACEAFALALIAPQPNLLAVDIDWQQFAASEMGRPWQAVIAGASRTSSAPLPAMPKDAGPRAGSLSALTRSQRDSQLQLLVQAEVARVLGLLDGAALDPREPLMNFGFESLMALRLKNNLEAEVGCALPATLVFDYPTIAGISHYLAQCLDEQSASEDVGAGMHRPDDPGDDAVTMILAELERLSAVTAMCEDRQRDSAVSASIDSVRGAR